MTCVSIGHSEGILRQLRSAIYVNVTQIQVSEQKDLKMVDLHFKLPWTISNYLESPPLEELYHIK
ncbi:hypothetical protein L598_002500000040 [Mesorhizobium sp. J18]|nr:hypothetical protein L598_002500000040 [Mesorhizobium sp. J18]